MDETLRKEKPRRSVGSVLLTLIGIIICLIFIPILALNTILIVKGAMDDSKPPAAFGYTPLVVLSGSMDSTEFMADPIQINDLIIVKTCDADNLEVGTVISFMENDYAVTHRIIAINTLDDGTITYTTKGDANNVQDSNPVRPENVIGEYVYQINGLGKFLLFIQSTKGMLLCIGVPLLLFIIYDVIRRQQLLKKERIKQDQLKQEIEQLRQDPNQVDLPREVLKKPQEEAQVVASPWFEPAPERMAETTILEEKPIKNLNNAEVRSNEPAPQKAKVKVEVPKKSTTVRKPTVVKVKSTPKK